jgi:hypothetical protein
VNSLSRQVIFYVFTSGLALLDLHGPRLDDEVEKTSYAKGAGYYEDPPPFMMLAPFL